MADTAQKLSSGRKFFIVKWLIAMWFFDTAALIVLAILKIAPIPQALGVSLATISGGIVGYIGVNVWQKKVQGSQLSNLNVTGGGS